MTFTETQAKRILEVVDKGLTKGLGNPIPGELCVEAAVSLALELPHGDNPDCVGYAVRKFKIALNDCHWASNASRAVGMRKLAVVQVGSDTIDQKAFAEIVAIQTVKQLIPRLFDVLGIKGAEGCHEVKTLEEAQEAAADARIAADAAARNAAADAADAAMAAAANAAYARAATAYTYVYIYDHAIEAAAYAALYAAKAAYYARRVTGSDEFLLLSAKIGLDALIQLNSPGCQFLYLCEVL